MGGEDGDGAEPSPSPSPSSNRPTLFRFLRSSVRSSPRRDTLPGHYVNAALIFSAPRPLSLGLLSSPIKSLPKLAIPALTRFALSIYVHMYVCTSYPSIYIQCANGGAGEEAARWMGGSPSKKRRGLIEFLHI